MITQKQMNRLFDTATEVGISSAIELLDGMRDNVSEHNGTFIDGFDYAIRALRKTNEVMRKRDR